MVVGRLHFTYKRIKEMQTKVRVEGKPQIKCNQREGISYSEIVGAAGVGFCFDAGSVFDSGPGHV